MIGEEEERIYLLKEKYKKIIDKLDVIPSTTGMTYSAFLDDNMADSGKKITSKLCGMIVLAQVEEDILMV